MSADARRLGRVRLPLAEALRTKGAVARLVEVMTVHQREADIAAGQVVLTVWHHTLRPLGPGEPIPYYTAVLHGRQPIYTPVD